MKTLLHVLCLALLIVMAACGTQAAPDEQVASYNYTMQSGKLMPSQDAPAAAAASEGEALTFSSDGTQDGTAVQSGDPAGEQAGQSGLTSNDGAASKCSGSVSCSNSTCHCRGDFSCCINVCTYLICTLCGC